MLNEEIADLLADLRRAKYEVKDIRQHLVKFAVEEIGLEQQEASQMDIAVFLDGYLVGRGMYQSSRQIKEPFDTPTASLGSQG
jgi:hypothetical protein